MASHVAGYDLTYKCVGQDSFLLTVNVFRDCHGMAWTDDTVSVEITSTCGDTMAVTLNTTNQIVSGNPVGLEVSQVCSMATTACGSGNVPGWQLYTFKGIADLGACNEWNFEYTPPCCAVPIEAVFNTQVKPQNNSPQFDADEVVYFGITGNTISYEHGVTEPDGDSLVFSIDSSHHNPYWPSPPPVDPQLYQQCPVPNGLTIDPVSGKIQFTPVAAGCFEVMVRVSEYDRQTGAKIGHVYRDMRISVDNALSSSVPNIFSADTISNFQGTANAVGPKTIQMCYGQTFNFSVEVSDPDVGDVLAASSNIQQVLPGAGMSVSPSGGGNPLTVTFSWTANNQANPFNTFNLRVSDQHCPVPAINAGTFNVRVIPGVYAGPDQAICLNGQSQPFEPIGGPSFSWSVVEGDMSSLSCTNCNNPVATPDTTTLYEVSSNLASGCKSKDTLMVEVLPLPDPGITTTGPFCELDDQVVINGVNPGTVSGTTPVYQQAVVNANTLDLTQLPAGTSSIGIKWTAAVGNCIDSAVHTLGITQQFDATIANPGSFCPHDSAVQLVNTDSTSLNTNGVWSGHGITNARYGYFDPSQVPSHRQSTTVFLDSAGLCGDRDSIVIAIDTVPNIGIDFIRGGEGPYCEGSQNIVEFEGQPEHSPGTKGIGHWNHLNGWLPDSVTEFYLDNSGPAVGTYHSTYTFMDLNGCINQDTLAFEVLPNPPLPMISYDQNANELNATLWNGDYEWFLNGNSLNYPVTTTGIPVNQSGDYYVEVTNACSTGKSDTLYIEMTSVDEAGKRNAFVVYPNPVTTQTLFIQFERAIEVEQINLMDVIGRNVDFNYRQFGNNIELHVENALSGMYLLEVQVGGRRYVERISFLNK